jgi:hypothetical protein
MPCDIPESHCSKESTAAKDVGTTVNRTMSQFNAEQSHEIVRCPPPDSVSRSDYEGSQTKNLNLVLTKESNLTKDVGTTVDKTMITVYDIPIN